jgi:Domain of unknown function (DUF397)
MKPLEWFKSSYTAQQGQCVEVSYSLPGLVPVRDSKDPQGPAIVFSNEAWKSFVSATVAGEFGEV